MFKLRAGYLIAVALAILAGLASRHFKFVPLFTGDVIWAMMIYFIMRFLFTGKTAKFAAIAGLLFCYAIEFSQVYRAPWLNNIRHTLPGHLVLGEGFLWSDLLCYLAGITTAYLIDVYWEKIG